MATSTYRIGDSAELLKELEPSSVDLIVTDPPYGYSFMGKDWDRAVPSVDIWRECLRVLKPGAFAFIMSAPRLDVQSEMARRIQEAGFDIAFTPLFWAYATGFPKAMNVGKAVDKKLGAEREVIGSRRADDIRGGNLVNQEERTMIYNYTAPATPQAKVLDGAYAGFQPKPALEVIIVAMKPLEQKTYVDQALANGHGCTWLDNGRIPFESEDDLKSADGGMGSIFNNCGVGNGEKILANPEGRFPANLLVSDDVLDDGTVYSSPKNTPTSRNARTSYTTFNSNSCGFRCENNTNPRGCNDSGGFSRYFSLDKWAEALPFLIVPKASKGEKNKGIANGDRCTHPTVKPLKLMSYLITLGSREGEVVLDPFAGSGTTLLAARMLNRSSIGFELSPEYIEILKARTGWLPPPLESFAEGGGG